MRILFVSSEAHPLIKTGGLADVSGSLPRALHNLGHDLRVLLPAYPDAVSNAPAPRPIARLNLAGRETQLLQTRLPGSRVTVWLLDCPALFDRPGNPYHDVEHHPWPDNAERFLLLCRAAAALAMDSAGLDWQPDVVHCNDWQTGLVAPLLARTASRPATVFTIHNLAYQGLFDYSRFLATGLPLDYWRLEALEFHGQFSYIKGGIVFADRVNTVSPGYALEIQSEAQGCGLDGLLRHRAAVLSGILNGIDDNQWNPGTDPHLPRPYNRQRLAHKRDNKLALQRELGLPQEADTPLIGFIGRLAEQKGIDLLLEALPQILALPAQVVILGSGARRYEQALADLTRHHGERFSLTRGYNEALAHRIEAGVDLFLMPSRYEPCGLNQMYSLRYGTVPVVHRVGGLADTVIDPADDVGTANGFCFGEPSAAALLAALRRALTVYRQPERWRELQRHGMARDFSWQHSAREYETLYRQALTDIGRPVSN